MIPPAVAISAVVSSFLLSLLALGFTFQYVTLNVPNLAYSTIAFFSTYITLTFALFKFTPYLSVPVSFLIGGLISLMMYKFLSVLRRRGLSSVGLMIATITFDLGIYAFMNIYADYIAYTLKVYTRSFILSDYDFRLGEFPGVLFVSMITAFMLTMVFHLILTRTKFGMSMRAIMENESLASTQGVNVDSVLSISWFLVGGIAGISGSLYPMWFSMDPWIGARMFISIFAACVVGGLRSIYGSMLGGFMIGLSEVLVTYAFAGLVGGWIWWYRSVIPMIIASVTILIIPNGIAGLIENFKRR
jgi:branched-chain amino acid transport system permease protein